MKSLRKAALALAGLTIALGNAYCAGGSEKSVAEEAYQKAVGLRAAQHFEEAALELDRAVALEPKVVRYRIERGSINLIVHRYDLAVLDYMEWNANAPDSAKAHGELSKALVLNKAIDKAIKEYSRAIELDSSNSLYFYGRAAALQHRRELWPALADYRTATEQLSTATDRSDLWYRLMYPDLSALLFELGYIDDAVRTYHKGKGLFPKDMGRDVYDLDNAGGSDVPVQIGKEIPDFEVGLEKGMPLAKKDLMGSPYVIFRWTPRLTLTTLYSEWAPGPMDALVLQDDVSMILDTYIALKRMGVKLISVATQPLGSGAEGQILRNRDRPWPLFELPAGSESWIAKADFRGSYRVIVVDSNGIIQLALLSENTEEIRATVLPLMEKLLQQHKPDGRTSRVDRRPACSPNEGALDRGDAQAVRWTEAERSR